MHTIRLVLPFFIFLFLFLTPAFATPVTYDYTYVIDDSWTYQLSTYNNTNYGNYQYMAVVSKTNGNARGFIAFDIRSQIPAGAIITDANLSLMMMANNPYTEYINISNTSAFNEDTITWTNQPSPAVLQGVFNVTAGGSARRVNFTVKDALQTSLNNNIPLYIILVDNVTTQAADDHETYFYTKEYTGVAHRPLLVVNYSFGTECESHDINGTWCDSYNLTMPCIWTNNIQPCYDVVTENPNPFNSSKNTFTTFSNSLTDCGIIHNQCPSGFMCVQYNSPLNHSFLPIVECYNGQTGQAYFYNETGDNSTNPFVPSCNNPTYWNNSWSCAINDCHWCFLSPEVSSSGGFCTAEANSCPATSCYNPSQYTNVSTCSAANCNWCDDKCQSNSCPLTICSSNYGGQIALQIGGLMGITDCSMSEWVLSMLLALATGFGVLYYGRDKKLGINGFVVGTMGMLILFTLIGWFPAWVMIIFIVISAYLMAKSMGFGGG